MDLDRLQQLTVEKIRAEADRDRRRGLTREAELGDHYADLVAQGLAEWWTEALTPEQASREVPWTAETVARRIGEDAPLPQAGEAYKPRVRRCDLHRVVAGEDPPGAQDQDAPEGPDVAGEILKEAV